MKFLTNIDLVGNQLLNVVVQVLASAPGSPAAGRFYYDSTLNKLRYYNGTTWVDLSSSSSDADLLNGHAGTYYLDRVNHSGTQTASTISDFASAVASALTAGDVALGSHKLTGVADPTNPQDAATKAYVDAQSQGLDIKPSVRAASTANLTLSGEQTIDGVAVVAGDRVLVKDQSTASQNGIYIAASGAWSRSTDANSSAKVTPGLYTFVEEGTAGADTGWVLTADAPITLGTTGLPFTQFAGAGSVTAGTGLVRTGNSIALDTSNGYGVRKAAADIGDGSATSITVTHNLNTRDLCGVWLRNNSSPYDAFLADVESTTINTVTIRFASAPTAAQYRAVISG
jgi:hypothetical protein